MSLLARVRENKEGCESLRQKGLLSPDEIEVLVALDVLRHDKKVT